MVSTPDGIFLEEKGPRWAGESLRGESTERVATLAAVSIPGFRPQFATCFCREQEPVVRDRVGMAMSPLPPLALAGAVPAGFADMRGCARTGTGRA